MICNAFFLFEKLVNKIHFKKNLIPEFKCKMIVVIGREWQSWPRQFFCCLRILVGEQHYGHLYLDSLSFFQVLSQAYFP